MSPHIRENTIPPEPIQEQNMRYGDQEPLAKEASMQVAVEMGRVLAKISESCPKTAHDERARTIMITLTQGVRGHAVMKSGTVETLFSEISALHQAALGGTPTISAQLQEVLEMANQPT